MKLTSEDRELLPLLAKVILEGTTSVEERLFSNCLTLEESLSNRPLDIRLRCAEPVRSTKKVVAKKRLRKRTTPLRAVFASIEPPKRIVLPQPEPPLLYTRSLGDGIQGLDLKKIGLEPLLEALYDALAQLTPREVDILRKRYSFSKGEAWTLEALGEKYGISRQRVQQIERNALKKLRQALNDKFLEKEEDKR